MVEILDNTLSARDILQLDVEHKHLRFIGIITRVELDTWCVAREGKPLAPPLLLGVSALKWPERANNVIG
jgi:hypothetical protein